jgi:hypothetical protein
MPDETTPEAPAPAPAPAPADPAAGEDTLTVPAAGMYAITTRIGGQSTCARLSLPAGELPVEVTIAPASY